jgi:hypothetical protein
VYGSYHFFIFHTPLHRVYAGGIPFLSLLPQPHHDRTVVRAHHLLQGKHINHAPEVLLGHHEAVESGSKILLAAIAGTTSILVVPKGIRLSAVRVQGGEGVHHLQFSKGGRQAFPLSLSAVPLGMSIVVLISLHTVEISGPNNQRWSLVRWSIRSRVSSLTGGAAR